MATFRTIVAVLAASLGLIWRFKLGIVTVFVLFSLLLNGAGWVSGQQWHDNWFEDAIVENYDTVVTLGFWNPDLSPDGGQTAPPEEKKDEAKNCLTPDQMALINASTDPRLTQDLKAQAKSMKTDDSGCTFVLALIASLNTPPAEEPEFTPSATATAEVENPVIATATTVTQASTADPSATAKIKSICDVRRTNTANEIKDAGNQRIEVGGGSPQVITYYTAPGALRVTYIIDPQESPQKWYGFGELWEEHECSDLLAWAKNETIRQVTANGHSGVILDLRTGTVYNVGTLSEEEIKDLLREQQSAM